jgi:hypothetical protein
MPWPRRDAIQGTRRRARNEFTTHVSVLPSSRLMDHPSLPISSTRPTQRIGNMRSRWSCEGSILVLDSHLSRTPPVSVPRDLEDVEKHSAHGIREWLQAFARGEGPGPWAGHGWVRLGVTVSQPFCSFDWLKWSVVFIVLKLLTELPTLAVSKSSASILGHT